MPLGSGRSFPSPILGTTQLPHTLLHQPQGVYMLVTYLLHFLYLFFWDCWDGEEIGGQRAVEAEKHSTLTLLVSAIYISNPAQRCPLPILRACNQRWGRLLQ